MATSKQLKGTKPKAVPAATLNGDFQIGQLKAAELREQGYTSAPEPTISVPGAPLPPAVGGDLLEPISDEALEKKIEQLKPTGPRLTSAHIQAVILDEIYTRIEGTCVTVCTLKLRNGYTVVGVNNGPVSPENFNQELGCEYAYKEAFEKIWTLEGYLLREFLADGKAKSDLNPIAEIAKACHEVNAALCRAFGDDSQPAWADAPDWQQMSAINGVSLVMNNPDAPPSATHEVWAAQKTADGWVRGDVKDAEAKTHPCLVPFNELPAHQQAKDHVFAALVHALKAGRHG